MLSIILFFVGDINNVGLKRKEENKAITEKKEKAEEILKLDPCAQISIPKQAYYTNIRKFINREDWLY